MPRRNLQLAMLLLLTPLPAAGQVCDGAYWVISSACYCGVECRDWSSSIGAPVCLIGSGSPDPDPTCCCALYDPQWCSDGTPAPGRSQLVLTGYESCDTYYLADRCPAPATPDVCGSGIDSDRDGCTDTGCLLGSGACTCTAECNEASCASPQLATCDPFVDRPEICGDEEDNNCNGSVDEGCFPPKDECNDGATAGFDPIMLANQSAVTEPFTDFSVETGLATLSITRTYASNDWAYFGGPVGIFGRGWHHNWEGTLSCSGVDCTVLVSGAAGYRFRFARSAPSLDGGELWDIYEPSSDPFLSAGAEADYHQVLARRPTGEWILFLPDGRTMHFGLACDTCADPATDRSCLDVAAGGKARLVKVVDAKGNAVQVAYGRAGGIMLSVSDELGHVLEIEGATACAQHAARLRYNGAIVAEYGYVGHDLSDARDAEGAVIRAYAYDVGRTERLLSVQNEGGDAVASFSYDADARAVELVDKHSSVVVGYGTPGGIQVTEHFNGTSATSTRTLNRDGRTAVLSENCACGPAREITWAGRHLVCSADSQDRLAWQNLDEEGRVTYRANYASASRCSTQVAVPGVESREEWRDYGLTRDIATGVSIALDRVVAVKRRSGIAAGAQYVARFHDYDPAPQPFDPVGYACQVAPLPTGSVECRRLLGGHAPDAFGSPVFERHALFYSYDSRGRLTKTIGPINIDRPPTGEVVPFEDRSYWPDSETLARRGRLSSVRRFPSPAAAPLVTSFDYDMFGVYVVTRPNSGTEFIVKDGRGRPIANIDATGRARLTRYYDGLEPRLHVLPSGGAVRFRYDTTGRLASREYLSADPEQPGASPILGWGEYYVYDTAGNRTHTERRDADGAITWKQERQYDVQHRIASDANPAAPGSSRVLDYDASGHLLSSTDEIGRKTLYENDALGRVRAVRISGGEPNTSGFAEIAATYAYRDFGGPIARIEDGAGHTTEHVYDDFGRLTAAISANLSGPSRFTYDTRGNVISREVGGVRVEYTHDGLDRVLTMSATRPGSPPLVYSFTYDEGDAEGYLTTVTEAERTIEFSYDRAGRLVSETIYENASPAAMITSYTYDSNGDLWGLTYPSGLEIRYTRDRATRRVLTVATADPIATLVFAEQVKTLPAGPVSAMTLGNGLRVSTSHNLRYEPTQISSGPVALSFVVNAAGEISSFTDSSENALAVSAPTAYSYDGAGNRLREARGPITTMYTYAVDRVEDVSAAGVRTVAFGYAQDSSVSAITKYDGAELTAAVCLRHDVLGRLVLLSENDASSIAPGGKACDDDSDVTQVLAEFKYNFRRIRVSRRVGEQWTYIVPDSAGRPLSEFALTGASWVKLRDYVWLDGQPLAQVEYSADGAPSPYYFHVDHLGSPRALSSLSGVTVWSASMTPFGELISERVDIDPDSGRRVVTNLRLPGQYDERLLGSLGLQGPYYNTNRWYLPSIGRYLELDPIALWGGMNGAHGPDWYSYAEGNPLSKADPFGLDAELCSRVFWPIPVPYARHCFIRFNGDNGDTSSFDTGGVHPDPAPPWLPRTCRDTEGPQNDECVKSEMKKCENYDFFGFNCCHCAEQALKACGLTIPPNEWPNWPVNPGPQPLEPGSCEAAPGSNVCVERG